MGELGILLPPSDREPQQLLLAGGLGRQLGGVVRQEMRAHRRIEELARDVGRGGLDEERGVEVRIADLDIDHVAALDLAAIAKRMAAQVHRQRIRRWDRRIDLRPRFGIRASSCSVSKRYVMATWSRKPFALEPSVEPSIARAIALSTVLRAALALFCIDDASTTNAPTNRMITNTPIPLSITRW